MPPYVRKQFHKQIKKTKVDQKPAPEITEETIDMLLVIYDHYSNPDTTQHKTDDRTAIRQALGELYGQCISDKPDGPMDLFKQKIRVIYHRIKPTDIAKLKAYWNVDTDMLCEGEEEICSHG
jgi:hypothetical protein